MNIGLNIVKNDLKYLINELRNILKSVRTSVAKM